MKMLLPFILQAVVISTISLAATIPETTTTEIPTPFKYSFAAGRRPGGKPDRYVDSQGDEYGTIKGSYTYLDPNYKWQRVNYEASKEKGFQILAGSTNTHPRQSLAVQKARDQHAALYEQIAASHVRVPVPAPRPALQESKAVQKNRNEFYNEYQRIAAEHARIEAEHAAIDAEHARIAARNKQYN